MKDINVKDIRKAAFAVGVGFTMGKFFSNFCISFVKNCCIITLKDLAKRGNEISQEICKGCDIKYEETEIKKSPKTVVTGFLG